MDKLEYSARLIVKPECFRGFAALNSGRIRVRVFQGLGPSIGERMDSGVSDLLEIKQCGIGPAQQIFRAGGQNFRLKEIIRENRMLQQGLGVLEGFNRLPGTVGAPGLSKKGQVVVLKFSYPLD
jgi:hypothetical protein